MGGVVAVAFGLFQEILSSSDFGLLVGQESPNQEYPQKWVFVGP